MGPDGKKEIAGAKTRPRRVCRIAPSLFGLLLLLPPTLLLAGGTLNLPLDVSLPNDPLILSLPCKTPPPYKEYVDTKSPEQKSTDQKPANQNKLLPGPPAATQKAVPGAANMSLADFLYLELGRKKFHRRKEWAGSTRDFQPITDSSRVWKPIGEVQYLTIHHSSEIPVEHPAKMIRRIYLGHTGRTGKLVAADVGYHFFVDRNGEIWEGRLASKMGTHVGSHPLNGENNEGNLGICGLGTFVKEEPTKAMTEATVDLCALIAKYYGRPLTVRGHKDWFGIHGFKPIGNTDCPGRLEAAVTRAQRVITASFSPKKGTEPAKTKAASLPSGQPDAPHPVSIAASAERASDSTRSRSPRLATLNSLLITVSSVHVP